MLGPPVVMMSFNHFRVVCPDCFDVVRECQCGGIDVEKATDWKLCEVCMKKNIELEKLAEAIPEGKLLDARMVFRKILPVMDFPKEFIPERLFPGYDQWKDKVLAMILSSEAEPPVKGVDRERREETQHPRAASADRGRVPADNGEAKGAGEAE